MNTLMKAYLLRAGKASAGAHNAIEQLNSVLKATPA